MFLTSFILFIILSGRMSTGVKITELKVPSTFSVDESDEVILDCIYEVEESLYSQLDIKWYFNDRPVPIYMWIPGYKPQTRGGVPFAMSLVSGASHLDGKEIHKYNEHRAIKIIHPDERHSGEYTCKVSTFVDEDSSSASMIVYGLPERQYLNASIDEIDSYYLDVECQFLRVFPKPIISLEWASRNNSGSLTGGTSSNVFPNEKVQGAFDVEIFYQIEIDSEEDMNIWCSLELPEVGQKVQLDYVYTFEKEDASGDEEGENGSGVEDMSGDEDQEVSGSGSKEVLILPEGFDSEIIESVKLNEMEDEMHKVFNETNSLSEQTAEEQETTNRELVKDNYILEDEHIDILLKEENSTLEPSDKKEDATDKVTVQDNQIVGNKEILLREENSLFEQTEKKQETTNKELVKDTDIAEDEEMIVLLKEENSLLEETAMKKEPTNKEENGWGVEVINGDEHLNQSGSGEGQTIHETINSEIIQLVKENHIAENDTMDILFKETNSIFKKTADKKKTINKELEEDNHIAENKDLKNLLKEANYFFEKTSEKKEAINKELEKDNHIPEDKDLDNLLKEANYFFEKTAEEKETRNEALEKENHIVEDEEMNTLTKEVNSLFEKTAEKKVASDKELEKDNHITEDKEMDILFKATNYLFEKTADKKRIPIKS
ncbi:uncharacterized protein [Lepeophtheirus salmonis]|uniref:uncharacterized protein isoform X1 n=1 Tax=Lepeophtheirus salmonis TaxID=72036 RepID=UPI003AF396AC